MSPARARAAKTVGTVAGTAELKREMAAGDELLGSLVFWTGLSDVRIPRQAFRDEFTRMGLGAAIGRDPKAEACLSQAAGQATTKLKRKGLAQVRLKDKGTHAVYAVLMRRDVTLPDQETRVRYLEEARIVIDRGQPSPKPVIVTADDVAQDDDRDEVIDAVCVLYRDLLDNVHTEEVSEALMEAMVLLGGLTLRPGVYFVPAANAPQLQALRLFLESYTAINLSTWDISRTSANAEQSARDARATFLDKIHELGEECRAFVAEKGEEEASAKSINTRIRRFTDLEGQVELFADILGDHAANLRATLEATREAFRTSVLG